MKRGNSSSKREQQKQRGRVGRAEREEEDKREGGWAVGSVG